MALTQDKTNAIRRDHQQRHEALGRSSQGRDITQAATTRGCIPAKKTSVTQQRQVRDGDPQPFAGLVDAQGFVRIMMMAPDPRNTDRLAVREEYDAIDTELRALENDDWCLERVLRCRVSEITEKLDKFRPNILHIGSHGGQGMLCFEDDSGESVGVSKLALARLLETQEGLKLVVLNSCSSGERDEQTQGMADVVGNVIGMSGTIKDKDAIAFSREFYRACGTGMKLSKAVLRARYAVNLTSPKFAVTLFERSPPGVPIRARLLSSLSAFLERGILQQCSAILIAVVVTWMLQRLFQSIGQCL